MATPFKTVSLPDNASSRFQDNVSNALDPLIGRPWVSDSLLLENVALTSGAVNRVPHKLGRRMSGYIIVRRNADCRIWDSNSDAAQTTEARTNNILLNTSANVTVSILVW